MEVLKVTIVKTNGGIELQRLVVAHADYLADDMRGIYFKYVKPYLDKFPKGTILEWKWQWEIWDQCHSPPCVRGSTLAWVFFSVPYNYLILGNICQYFFTKIL